MPGEAVKRQQQDEDTEIGFHGHMTNQANDESEQRPDDPNRRQHALERTPDHPDKQDYRKEKKRNRGDRK